MKSRLALLSLVFSVLSSPIGAHASWTVNGVPISTAVDRQIAPQIVSDGSGGAIITWYDLRSGNYDVYVQRVNGSGVAQWTADGVALCTAAGDQSVPTITSDGSGGAIVTWADARSGTNYDIYAQRINASGVVQWAANGVALCTAASDQSIPTIVSDGSGGAIATWEDHRSGYYDIYAQRINASGAVQWTADGVALSTASTVVNIQQYPTITSDGSSGAIVTWADYRSGVADIYAQRVSSSGAVQWTANGVATCVSSFDQLYPTIVSDGSAGAIVTWYDLRSGINYDIYAQRLNSAGAAQWIANGVALCSATGSQANPMIVSDGSGGAIVAWQDTRSGGVNSDIYAQRVNGSGVAQWTADGVALCTAADRQEYPTITSDGSAGAIVSWWDLRNGSNYDTYAQRVSSSGVPLWTAGGVAASTPIGNQEFSVIASDGSGGAIVAWQDTRSGSGEDIYALRLGSGGEIPTSVGNTPSFAGVSLSPNSPNPFTGETTMDLNLVAGANVNVTVYDVAGREVRRMGRSYESAGLHRLSFDGRDDKDRPLASGMYFYKVTANGRTITQKMVIAR